MATLFDNETRARGGHCRAAKRFRCHSCHSGQRADEIQLGNQVVDILKNRRVGCHNFECLVLELGLFLVVLPRLLNKLPAQSLQFQGRELDTVFARLDDDVLGFASNELFFFARDSKNVAEVILALESDLVILGVQLRFDRLKAVGDLGESRIFGVLQLGKFRVDVGINHILVVVDLVQVDRCFDERLKIVQLFRQLGEPLPEATHKPLHHLLLHPLR
mmetsp:Transcript_23022/g.57192  ORF Transcript_23022/g.57192 Transcript_23022/m.57192 type:complete len:218 (+) Transcript_23022:1082-1735(+)